MIDKHELPPLVFGGLSKLQYAACVLVGLEPDKQACKAWLTLLQPLVHHGPAPPATYKQVCTLALTATGLSALGLDDRDLATFTAAFVNGMSASPRARALGDVGPHAPEHWDWGAPQSPVDAAILVYADDQNTLNTAIAALPLGDPAVRLHRQIDLQPRQPLNTEPFGFRDGVSQPIISELRRGTAYPPDQAVAMGEIVLGYADNNGYFPSVPTVDPSRDERGILPTIVGGDGRCRCDLGRNSSYLVIRQLKQDVTGFRDHVAAQATTHNIPAAELAAKMLGRWPNGSSLVRHPRRPGPGPEPDNDFLFGIEDPDGLACPLGAHIRRANPRDSLRVGQTEPLVVTNRHRILRVGRPYITDSDKPCDAAGLLFMCLNAEIERQFELVQQSWVNRPAFHGLRDEVDPIIGHAGPRCFTIPTRQGPIRLEGLPDFVKPLGGAYFWMPSLTAMQFLAA